MQVPGIQDWIQQPLYDTVLVTSGTTLATFFQQPIGQGTEPFNAVGVAGGKTLASTNMDLAGQLAAGFFFQLMGFRVAYPWNVTQADISAVLNAAVFTFTVGAKPFLQVPLRTLPSGNGPFGFYTQTAAATAAIATSGWPSMQNGFAIGRKPLTLKATENFKVTITWPASAGCPACTTTGFQVATSLPITVYLDGYLGRPVQ